MGSSTSRSLPPAAPPGPRPTSIARAIAFAGRARAAAVDPQLQRCATRLTRGRWVHAQKMPRHLDAAWSWQVDVNATRPNQAWGRRGGGAGQGRCQLLNGDLVRKSLVNTWVLVVGDSVARIAYAALLALFNGTDPAFGWPTHRVSSGDCVEHVVTADAERFRMDVPHCTMRWKGICHEWGFGDNLEDYCWLDYLVASTGVRLTFLWHTVNRAANLQELSMRVRTLKQAAGRAPDVVLTSTGPWDLMYPRNETCSTSNCCQGVARLLKTLAAASARKKGDKIMSTRRRGEEGKVVPLLVMLGLMRCPVCPRPNRPANSAGFACAHFGHRGAKEPGTQECGSRLAAAAGFVFLDSQPFVDSLPHGIVGSICATNHPLGVLADALVLALASLLLDHTRPGGSEFVTAKSRQGKLIHLRVMPSEQGDHTRPNARHGQMVSWPPIKTGMRASSLLCASDRACELTSEFKTHLQRLASPGQSLPAGARAGLCGPTQRHGCRPEASSGFWQASHYRIENLAACAAQCRSSCAACRFVSFSVAHDDCSWYNGSTCNMSSLMPAPSTGPDYTTMAV